MELEDMDIVDGCVDGNDTLNGNRNDTRTVNTSGEFLSPIGFESEANNNVQEDEDETTDIVIPPVLSRTSPQNPPPSNLEGNESQDSRKIWDFVKRKFKFGHDFGPPLASCQAQDFEYNMNHPLRGKAIIFNHTKFDPTQALQERSGSDKDAADLRLTFERLNFKVEIFNDVKRHKLHTILEAESLENHNNEDCIVVIVMTHGQTNALHAFDDVYKPEELWLPFTADKCPSLAGKPKMFFIQACRGDKYDHGTTLMKPSRTETDGPPRNIKTYKIPNHADFLVVFSTAPASTINLAAHPIENRSLLSRFFNYMSLSNIGHFSWRSSIRGGCFVQALCRVLDQYAWDLDILSMITVVNREVAINYESNVPRDATQHQKKQVPHVTHTLTRQIRLSQKQVSGYSGTFV